MIRRPARRAATPSRETARRRIARALDGLAAGDRVILALLLLEHLSHRDAARALGVTPRGLTRRYRTALAELGRAALAGPTKTRGTRTTREPVAPGEALRRAS